MKKIVLLFICISTVLVGYSQNIYKTTAGEISFFSKTPMEDIDAVNKKVKGLINVKTKGVAFVSTIIGFKFKKPLMEEHFNENYMESDKFKTAIFKGKIVGEVDFEKDGVYTVKAEGVLNIHGVEKNRTIEGVITVKDGKISLDCKFDVDLADHNIDIPKLVVKNLAKTIKVTVNMDFELKK